MSRNTLANANEQRDWRIYADLAQLLIRQARELYADDPAYFVIRAKSNLHYRQLYSRSVDQSTGLRSDQTIKLNGVDSSKAYPGSLRRIRYFDAENHKYLTVLTNQFTLPALTIAGLYRRRWQVELFFKWIKQHLRIKAFYGTSENAVKTQIRIAISVYILVAILKKRLRLEHSLYTILHVLSITLLEKQPVHELFTEPDVVVQPTSDQDRFPLFEGLEQEPGESLWT